jgi:hypothetical protein
MIISYSNQNHNLSTVNPNRQKSIKQDQPVMVFGTSPLFNQNVYKTNHEGT